MTKALVNLTTIRGVPLGEIFNQLAELFEDPQAYKEAGVSYLTDINTGYMYRRLEQVFGTVGVGWKLEFDPVHLQLETTGKQSKAILTYSEFCFLLVDKEAFKAEWRRVPTAGSSVNNEPGYAITGAMTSSISKAIAMMGFQNSVYIGLVNHRNISKVLKQYGSGFGQMKAAGENKGSQNKGVKPEETANRSSLESENETGNPKGNPHGGNSRSSSGSTDGNQAVDDPADFVVNIGQKHKGKKLGEIPISSVRWYARDMVARNAEARELQSHAVRYLYKMGPEPV